MKPNEIFGVVLRIIGVILLIRALLDVALAINFATSGPDYAELKSIMEVKAVIYVVVGALLLFGTKQISRMAFDTDQRIQTAKLPPRRNGRD